MTTLDAIEERVARTRMPRPATPIVRRARLEALLSDGVRRHVTLLSAPPGAGKTTLLSSWAWTQPAGSVAWLTMDPDHNSSGGFARAVLGALAERGEAGPQLDEVDGLAGFAAELDRLAVAHPRTVLVLDDVQEITTPGATQMLSHLVHRGPFDVIIATRADPPIRAGRGRLEGRLGSVRNADLMFSLVEAGELFTAYGLHLRRDDVAALWRRTEGWAAGLALVATALQGGADPHRFAQDEEATEAAVSDYLLTEVLAALDDKLRQFLLRTSVADRINADLATILSGDPGAGHQLAVLEQQGLFLVGLDGEWYRYHPLLAALLRARLRRDDPQLCRDLHGLASRWFAARGLTREAEEHAAVADDWKLLGDLVGVRWLDSIRAGERTDVGLDRVPSIEILRTPLLAAIAAGESSRCGDATAGTRYVDALDPLDTGRAAATGGSAPPFSTQAAAVLVARVLYGCAFGPNERSVAAARALSNRAVDSRLRSFALLRRVELVLDRGDLDGAKELLLEFSRSSSIAPSSACEADALLALVLALQGRATAALRLATATPADGGRLRPIAQGTLQLAEAIARAELGQRTNGHLALELEVTEATFHGSHPLAICARTVRGVGEVGAQTWLESATAHHPLAEHVLVALGVLEVVDPTGTSVTIGGPAEAAVRRAREAVANGSFGAAYTALEPWSGPRAATAHVRTRVEIATLLAVASNVEGLPDQAASHLRTAFEVASAPGMLAPLTQHAGRLKARLEAFATAPGPHQGLALHLLDDLSPIESQVFVEPLTDRETVVLEFLPTMMSNAEIAATMHLSVNTVKTHLKSLYRKLGVDSRRQAVRRARQLELT